ncbi:MAG: hypothetical protein IT539_03095 [Bradyrhizobiaceae bacterium]|nr:hypothetical protein [Bradyrhizobiaceae bacterium]
MPYARARYYLTPPSLAIFAISLVLAIAAFLVRYLGIAIPILNTARIFDVLAIAYILLMLGVLVRRI